MDLGVRNFLTFHIPKTLHLHDNHYKRSFTTHLKVLMLCYPEDLGWDNPDKFGGMVLWI